MFLIGVNSFKGAIMISLRFFIQRAGVLGSALLMFNLTSASNVNAQPPFEFMEATIPQLQAALFTGTITSRDLVAAYLARIEAYDKRGPALNAISVVNTRALDEAAVMDAERDAGKSLGPGRYRNEGSRSSSRTSPGFVSWGMGSACTFAGPSESGSSGISA